MARRNHLYLFAWISAIVLPLALQLVAGWQEEVRVYLAYYYGPISLYMFFAMTYGFATVFVSYYQVSSFRREGTLDCLRVSELRPIEMIFGIIVELETILVPPMLAFAALFGSYMLLTSNEQFSREVSWLQISGFAIVLVLHQAILALVPCLALYRREAMAALLAAVLVLPLNALPVLTMFVWGVPAWVYLLGVVSVLGILFLGAVLSLSRLWPPQRTLARHS